MLARLFGAFSLSRINLFNSISRGYSNMNGDSKVPKLDSAAKLIGTHSGTFHCDEVAACWMLHQLPEYKDAKIVRSRDPEELAKCDIVVDVGAVYDPSKKLFDHHQRSFNETMRSILPDKQFDIKLSSAGLIYVHFGKDVISAILKKKFENDVLEMIFDELYESFILEIDAIDNGVLQSDSIPRYEIHSGLSSRVGNLNPWWNQTDVDITKRFEQAMDMVGSEFLDRLDYIANCKYPSRVMVESAIKNRFNVHPSGSIVKLEQGGVPYLDHLFALEARETKTLKEKDPNAAACRILFVVYQDQNSKWMAKTVPPNKLAKFQQRLPFPEPWRGLRDQELSEKIQIPKCVFVHATGFMGGNETYDGLMQMLSKALQYEA